MDVAMYWECLAVLVKDVRMSGMELPPKFSVAFMDCPPPTPLMSVCHGHGATMKEWFMKAAGIE
jgi:hypothetical protein